MVHHDLALLSPREKDVLRLLARGHDTKSAARTLGLSIHTVNERLRDARRKLQVSSSREAARLLMTSERASGQFFGAEEIGFAPDRVRMRKAIAPATAGHRQTLAIGALLMVLTALIAIGAYAIGEHSSPSKTADSGAPKVVETRPANGSTIAPGPYSLSVTFDQPMMEGDYAFVQVSPQTATDCEPRATQSADRRTFVVRCKAAPGKHYEVWFNRPPYMSFQGLSGMVAEPKQLLFSVRSR
jgi:DNA-binding CsgD family transcriptional regulator